MHNMPDTKVDGNYAVDNAHRRGVERMLIVIEGGLHVYNVVLKVI